MSGAVRERVIALVVGPATHPSVGVIMDAAQPGEVLWCGGIRDLPAQVAHYEGAGPVRWVVWSAGSLGSVVRDGVHIRRLHDVAEAHRLIHGGWDADPGRVWALHDGLDPRTVPEPPSYDLFDSVTTQEDHLLRPDGHVRADAVHGDWLDRETRLRSWAHLLLDVAAGQVRRAELTAPRLSRTIRGESSAALLCVELRERGLPIDRARMTELIATFAGPRTTTDAAARRVRQDRDDTVLRHAPGWEHVDLRNPAKVRQLLAGNGIDVPTTRKWVLEAYRDTHPLVAALLQWRTAERIATTYGYRWLDEHVGPDDRLRGDWTACDGAGGRMTADNGLHNLPTQLRDGVAAHPGHLFVRADLGQIEPRVLAVVSGDEAFAAATREDDLYAPVARELGVERAVAKVAVLAAMYGQRSGTAGEALTGLQAAYPVAMGLLDRAYAVGVAGEDLRTFGGRLIHSASVPPDRACGTDPAADAARGRFARNAIIQGAAAELFKAWAATVRATVQPLGAEIVLCLHDELLVHTPAERAATVAEVVDTALTDAARRWSGTDAVRFVADVSVIDRWSRAGH